MALPSVSPDDVIASELWNEMVAFVNGTTPESGTASPGQFVRFNSAAAYAVTAGNVDTTNGLAFKAQYGNPDGTPTTLFTVAKAGIDHQVLATFRATGGKAIAALADTPKSVGGSWAARDYTAVGLIHGSQSGATITGVDTDNEMVHITRYLSPTSVTSAESFMMFLQQEVTGAIPSNRAFNTIGAVAHSFGTGAHQMVAGRFDGYGNVTGSGGWGIIAYGIATVAGAGALGSEIAAFNNSGVDRAAFTTPAVGVALVPPAEATYAINIGSLGANKNTVGVFFQGTAASQFWHGLYFDRYSIASGGVALDLRALGGSGATPMVIPNNMGLWALSSAGALIPMLLVNGSNQTEVRSAGTVRMTDAAGTGVFGTFTSAGLDVPAITGPTWTTFAPSVTQSAALTMTVNYARYIVIGKLAHVQIQMTYSSGAAVAGNNITVTGIPAAIQPARTGSTAPGGVMTFFDNSTSTMYVGAAMTLSTTTVVGYISGAVGQPMGQNPNVALAASDVVSLDLMYETA